MSLTDPELDLLLEMLEDDPADEVYVQVGEELVRRTRWTEALRVLAQGVVLQGPRSEQVRALELLARVYLELGRYDDALAALADVTVDPVAHPERARVEILALERSGRLDRARSQAVRFLQVDGLDVIVRSVVERLAAPPPSPRSRAADPFYTVQRAERYVELGRADRAVRVYRKILLANPANLSIEHRMQQLLTTASDVDDDLSAELTDPGLVPEEPDAYDALATAIAMPTPSFATPTPVHRELTPVLGVGLGSVDEDPTMKMDVGALLRRYAESGGYEEEDTIVDLTILTDEDDPPTDPEPRSERSKRSGSDRSKRSVG